MSLQSSHLHSLNTYLKNMQGLEIQRLKAARAALERRYLQLDGSRDRRDGGLTPFIPESDRPWQRKYYDRSLTQSIEQEHLKTDPTADVSMQWDVPQHEANVEALQKEMVRIPILLANLSSGLFSVCSLSRKRRRICGKGP